MKQRLSWQLVLILAAWALVAVAMIFHLRQQSPASELAVTLAASARGGSSLQGALGDGAAPFPQGLLPVVQAPWVGDLDGMLQRRLIRVLIVPSATMYFLERGRPRGIAAEFQAALQTFIDQRFPAPAKHLKTSVVVVPMRGDDLLAGLLDGRGDIAAASLAMTAERMAKFDFSDPIGDAVDEIAVTGSGGRFGWMMRANSPLLKETINAFQLLPSTGAAMQVGDVRKLEPNIHAGAKYLRFLIDRYFADDDLDDLNQALFAFAAYNAGPDRIRRLRALTATRGLDPNVWFDNVELVASERIGAEPVRYVSNIFKAYVGYKLLEQHRAERRRAKAANAEDAR